MIDIVEASFDVPLNNPRIWQPVSPSVLVPLLRQGCPTNVLQGAVGVSAGSKPIRDMPELRLEDRLQKDSGRALYDAVSDGGDAQGSELPRFPGLWNELAPGRTWPICTTAQISLKIDQEAMFTPVSDTSHRHPVNPGRASTFVGGNALLARQQG